MFQSGIRIQLFFRNLRLYCFVLTPFISEINFSLCLSQNIQPTLFLLCVPVHLPEAGDASLLVAAGAPLL